MSWPFSWIHGEGADLRRFAGVKEAVLGWAGLCWGAGGSCCSPAVRRGRICSSSSQPGDP